MNVYYFPRTLSRKAVVTFPVSVGGQKPAPGADTVRLFVEALSMKRLEEARAYISRDCAHYFDLPELSAYFSQNYNYKRLQKAELEPKPKNCVTDSILVQECNKSSIIHLHMIKELGIWKIYDIDKE